MRRIAASVALLVALTLGAGVTRAGGERQASASALRLVETLTVPSAPKGGAVVKSRTRLVKGRTYRLVATGAITQSKTDVTGRTVTYRLDPLYCFETTDPAFGGNCSAAVPVYSPRLQLTLPPSRTPASSFDAATPGPTRPPYSARHRYPVAFKAPASGPIYARTEPVPSVAEDSYSGAYRIEIHAQAPAKKKKRRKKQAGRCLAPVSRALAAQVSPSCQWVVAYSVEQEGEPASSTPERAVRTETAGLGGVFFKARPKRGQRAFGSAAAVIVHSDTPLPIGEEADQQLTLIARPRKRAIYRHDRERRVLALELQVKADEGLGATHPTREGTLALLTLVDNRSRGGQDLMRLEVCGTDGCPPFTSHAHNERNRDDDLEVTIGLPQPR